MSDGPRICPDCRMPTWPAFEHECGHNEWRFLVVRDGRPHYVAAMTTNIHELPATRRHLAKVYERTDPNAAIVCQRRWVDGWSVVEEAGS